MIRKSHACIITPMLCGCLVSFIMISAYLIVSNVGAITIMAITIMANNLNIKISSFSNQSSNATQSSTDAMMERGDIAMGFNQNKISHQFIASPFGGGIIITALNGSDRETIDQIKKHVLEIQKEFSQGNFSGPFFIHAQDVPGTNVMSQKKDLIKYDKMEMKNGSSLILTTNDKELIDAINQFMEFQARQHHGH